jgi:hypothetical protein
MCGQTDKPPHSVFILHTSYTEHVTGTREDDNVIVLVIKLLSVLPSVSNPKYIKYSWIARLLLKTGNALL